MCLFDQPKPQTKTTEPPVRENIVDSKTDTVSLQAEQEKKRKGYQSTIATSGSGLFDVAPVKKVTLGS